MERFLRTVLWALVALFVLGLALARFNVALIVLVTAGLIGRHLRKHGA
jgi:uncharacterized membrane protein YraQ (UPF0718 family)